MVLGRGEQTRAHLFAKSRTRCAAPSLDSLRRGEKRASCGALWRGFHDGRRQSCRSFSPRAARARARARARATRILLERRAARAQSPSLQTHEKQAVRAAARSINSLSLSAREQKPGALRCVACARASASCAPQGRRACCVTSCRASTTACSGARRLRVQRRRRSARARAIFAAHRASAGYARPLSTAQQARLRRREAPRGRLEQPLAWRPASPAAPALCTQQPQARDARCARPPLCAHPPSSQHRPHTTHKTQPPWPRARSTCRSSSAAMSTLARCVWGVVFCLR